MIKKTPRKSHDEKSKIKRQSASNTGLRKIQVHTGQRSLFQTVRDNYLICDELRHENYDNGLAENFNN